MSLEQLVSQYNAVAEMWNEVRVKMAGMGVEFVTISAEKKFLEEADLTLSVGMADRLGMLEQAIKSQEKMLITTARKLILLQKVMFDEGLDVTWPDGTKLGVGSTLTMSDEEVLSIVCFPLFKKEETVKKHLN